MSYQEAGSPPCICSWLTRAAVCVHGNFSLAVTGRKPDCEQEVSWIDSPDSLNCQLALMSILILMRSLHRAAHFMHTKS